MFSKASITFPNGRKAEVEVVRTLILLCQDRDRQYAVIRGARNDVQRLLVWGSRNWFLLPPGESYFQAVAEILEAGMAPHDATPLDLVSPSCSTGARLDGGMTCEISLSDRKIALTGIADLLLFAIDEHGVMLRATGGSGIQKHFLLEQGIAAVFGADAARRFADKTFSGAPDGTRRLLEGMRDQMRRQPDEDLVVTPEAADAIFKKTGKN